MAERLEVSRVMPEEERRWPRKVVEVTPNSHFIVRHAVQGSDRVVGGDKSVRQAWALEALLPSAQFQTLL